MCSLQVRTLTSAAPSRSRRIALASPMSTIASGRRGIGAPNDDDRARLAHRRLECAAGAHPRVEAAVEQANVLDPRVVEDQRGSTRGDLARAPPRPLLVRARPPCPGRREPRSCRARCRASATTLPAPRVSGDSSRPGSRADSCRGRGLPEGGSPHTPPERRSSHGRVEAAPRAEPRAHLQRGLARARRRGRASRTWQGARPRASRPRPTRPTRLRTDAGVVVAQTGQPREQRSDGVGAIPVDDDLTTGVDVLRPQQLDEVRVVDDVEPALGKRNGAGYVPAPRVSVDAPPVVRGERADVHERDAALGEPSEELFLRDRRSGAQIGSLC